MKYKIMNKERYDNIDNLLDNLLKSRGVEDVEALLNVSKANCHDYNLLTNIKEGVECLDKHIKNNSKICIIIDPDYDGNVSAAEIYLYIKRNFGIECSFVVHSGKQHGIVMKELRDINFDFDLLIVPDGGSSDYKQHKELKEMGKDILILDHHQADYFSEDAIVINPCVNGDKYPNKHLAGVGVVYKFCQALDDFYQIKSADSFLDLVACGNIADSMDLRELETRYLTLEGIKMLEHDKKLLQSGIKNGKCNAFIRAIIDSKKDRDLKFIDITSIGWKISPMINGTCRAGEMEEKIDMFRAFIEIEEERMYQPRRKVKTDPKPDPIPVTLQEDMVRKCTNIKARQDKAVKTSSEKLEEKIIEKNLNENKVLMVDGTGIIEDKSLTGLIANKLASKYKKPVMILKKMSDDFYGGSARNFNMSPIESLLDLTNSLGTMSSQGHPNAHGIKIATENLVPTRDKLNEILKDVSLEDVYMVDFEIPVGRLRKEDVLKVGKYSDIWGNTLKKPQFAITNITLDVGDIEMMGDKKNIIKFKKGDITFIKFYTNEDCRDQMIMRDKNSFGKSPKQVVLDIIGELECNEYEGVLYPQVVIKDFNTRKKEDILF